MSVRRDEKTDLFHDVKIVAGLKQPVDGCVEKGETRQVLIIEDTGP